MAAVEVGPLSPPVDDRGEQRAWYFYDWANSAFALVVSVLFGPYLTGVARAAADPEGLIHPLGVAIPAGALFPYVLSLSGLIQLVSLPVLGAIADYSRVKKQMLGAWTYLGALATLGLALPGTRYLLTAALFALAHLAFVASTVFYNAFLPEIASPARRDVVSSNGWALGYLGGGLLLAVDVVLLSQATALGLTPAAAVRVAFATVALWWAAFSLIPLLGLRRRAPTRSLPPGESYLTVGFRRLRATTRQLGARPQTLRFLGASTIYGVGISAVITLSAQFAQEELALPLPTITAALLLVQFVAFPCGIAAGRVATVVGTRRTIVLTLLVWLAIVLFSGLWMRSAADFFVAAALSGTVIGGSQALSRSLFSQMIPADRESEYFALAEVAARALGWLGPLSFGLSLQLSGSYRDAILVTGVFFLAGLALLASVDVRRAVAEGRTSPPVDG